MVNADPDWIYWQQMFQNACEGQNLKDMLILCLRLTLTSHNQNVTLKNSKYNELIWWDPEINPSPPPGWSIDPVDNIWKKEGGIISNGS